VAQDGVRRALGRDATRDGEIALPRHSPSRANDTGAHNAAGRLYCSGTRRPRRAVRRRRCTVGTLRACAQACGC
jgi:hypothetical protein